MKTTKTNRILIWTIAAAVALGAGAATAQAQGLEKVKPNTKAGSKEAPLATHEEVLQRMVGTWDLQARIWIDPAAEPVEMMGTGMTEPALDGKFMQTRMKGEIMGDSILGLGMETYDTDQQKFVGVWMDTGSTGMASYAGTYDDETKTLTAFGEMFDPDKKKMRKTKNVTTFRSSSMYTYELWVQDDEGNWVKMMEMLAGRIK